MSREWFRAGWRRKLEQLYHMELNDWSRGILWHLDFEAEVEAPRTRCYRSLGHEEVVSLFTS